MTGGTPTAGTLRWAVEQADAATSPVTIDFSLGSSPATIALTQGQLVLSNTAASIAIDGPGAGLLSISGDGASRIFRVASDATVSLSGLTITGGSVGGPGNGGGILNDGSLTLSGCTIAGNSAVGSGAGLENDGSATLNACTIADDVATGSSVHTPGIGGAIDNPGSAVLTGCTISGNAANEGAGLENGSPTSTLSLTGCTISDNTATGPYSEGGGLDNSGTANLRDCTISGNSALSGAGLSMGETGSSSTVANLTDCTVSGNTASNDGGGLLVLASARLTDCTIAGNSAGYGGGLDNGGTAALLNCTVSGNSATLGGGLVSDEASPSGGATMTSMTDTIAAGNSSAGGNGHVFGDILGRVSGSYNLIGDTDYGAFVSGSDGNIVLGNLEGLGLGPLTDNGGPTETMALLPGSLAIGTGTAVAGVNADQRGQPIDSPPDIGAYQAAPTSPPAHRPTSPTVVGIVGVQHVKKKVIAITIAFNEAIDPASLGRYFSYGVLPVVKRRRPGPVNGFLRSASFSLAPNELSLVLRKPYKGQVQVSLSGDAEALDGLLGSVSFMQIVK